MSAATDYFNDSVEYLHGEEALRLLEAYSDIPPDFVVWDTETTSLDPWSGTPIFNSHRGHGWRTTTGGVVFSVQLGLYSEEYDKLYCIFVNVEDEVPMQYVRKILANPDTLKIGHNVKFDIQMCENSSIPVRGEFFDTLTASRLTRSIRFKHDLKSLGNYFAGTEGDPDKWDAPIKKSLSDMKRNNARWSKVAYFEKTGWVINSKHEYIKDFVNYSFVPEEIMIEYGLADVWYTFLLYISMRDEVEAKYHDLFKMEMEYIRVAMDMEQVGVEIDRPKAMKAERWLLKRADSLLSEIKRIALKSNGMWSYNPASSKQTIELLLALGVPLDDLQNQKKKTSADAYVLANVSAKHSHIDFVSKFAEYRTCIKLANTYHHAFLSKTKHNPDRTLRFNLKPSDTSTGRSSCTNPNLQNIPNAENEPADGIPVRSVFKVRDGCANLYLDYSQIEMVIFALFCQEEGILEAVLNKEDLHSFTARKLIEAGILKDAETPKGFKSARKIAKTTNFAIIYGAGIQKVADQLGISYTDSAEFRSEYFRIFPGVESFIKRCKQEIYTKGYVEDIFGKQYCLPADGHYKAANRVIQGCAANVLKAASIQVNRVCQHLPMWKPLLPIHDELWVQVPLEDVPHASNILKHTMQNIKTLEAYNISVDVDVEYSTTYWSDKKDLTGNELDILNSKKYFENHGVIIPHTAGDVGWFM